MQPCLSSQITLFADDRLLIAQATESFCIGASRTVQTSSLDHLLGTLLSDSIPGLEPDEAAEACRTIMTGGRFPGGFAAYRKMIMVSDPEPERRVILLSPKLENDQIRGVICRVSRTFLRYPQADILTAEDYQAMVENCMEFMFVIDELGFHTYVSPTIRATMGAEPETVYGMHMSEIVHPDDVEQCQMILDDHARKGLPVTDIQYRLILPGGILRHIAVSGHVLDTGEGVRLVGIAKDVTETMELRRKLQARQNGLAALSNIVLTLSSSGDLDHALRSALNEVLSFLKLPSGGINVLSADGTDLIAGVVIGTDRPEIPPQALMAHLDHLCAEPGEIRIVRDVASDRGLDETMRAGLLTIGVHGFVLVRFQSMLGQHACMALDIPSGGELSVEQIEFLNLATGILGPAIENAVLQLELADRANQLALLERMALSINSGLDVRSVFTACQASLRELIDCDETCLVIFGAGRIAEVYAFLGSDAIVHSRKKLSKQQMRMFSGMSKASAWADPSGLPEYRGQHKEHRIESGSIAAAPLVYKGAVTGLLKIRACRDGVFGHRAASILQTVAEHLAIAVANARLYEAEHARTLELEALGREMQHRIKNNLQSIAGLLSMSSHDSEKSVGAVERCLRQVRAISTVHSLLAPGRMAAGVRLKRLLREVAENVVAASGRSEDIQVSIEGRDCRLAPDTAVALGVILNELVSNALEHGLASRDRGSLTITTVIEPARTTVELADDGVGLPKGFRTSQKSKSGLGLVSSLVKYGLHGEFSITGSESGSLARIEF